jgi:hypothetical protein
VQVTSFKWADSQHVAHFKTHPEQYALQLSSFAAAVLSPAPVKAPLPGAQALPAESPAAKPEMQAKLPLSVD